jgi:hypothetical protein
MNPYLDVECIHFCRYSISPIPLIFFFSENMCVTAQATINIYYQMGMPMKTSATDLFNCPNFLSDTVYTCSTSIVCPLGVCGYLLCLSVALEPQVLCLPAGYLAHVQMFYSYSYKHISNKQHAHPSTSTPSM